MELKITVVGFHSLADYVMETLLRHNNYINAINTINYGSLGNFATLTYGVDIDTEKFLAVRRDIINDLTLPGSPIICMYEHGASKNVYIFSKTAFKVASEDG